MTITHSDINSKGAFLINDGDVIAGEMTYSWAGADKFIIQKSILISQEKGLEKN